MDISKAEIEAIEKILVCAQGVLTAMNVGKVEKESLLHKNLRSVMIDNRDAVKQFLKRVKTE